VVELSATAVPLALALGVHGPQDVTTVVERTKVWVMVPETVYENTEPSDWVTIDWPRAREKKARRLNNAKNNFIVGNWCPAQRSICNPGRLSIQTLGRTTFIFDD